MPLPQRRPEARILLRVAEVVRAQDQVEGRAQAGLRQFQFQRARVRVGHQPQALAGPAYRRQEPLHARQRGDQVRIAGLERGHVQAQLAAPVIHAVPGQLPAPAAKQRFQVGARIGQRQATGLGVVLRQVLLPEGVVELEVEQRAVHVEHDGVDRVPVDERIGVHRVYHNRPSPTEPS
jgi:hypothetical protein